MKNKMNYQNIYNELMNEEMECIQYMTFSKPFDEYNGSYFIVEAPFPNALHHLWFNDEDENNVKIMKHELRTAYDDVLIKTLV